MSQLSRRRFLQAASATAAGATFAISGTTPNEQGKFLNILKRQADGSWKVAITMFKSD